MTPDEFTLQLQNIASSVKSAIENELPTVVGRMAVDHFKENFQNEGFTDNSLEPWQEVKRRSGNRTGSASDTRNILTGETGDLGRSINYDISGPGQITISSDKPYASAHNEGTTNAGRNRNVTIPQRKFIGDSAALNDAIVKEIEETIDCIMKNRK